MTNQLEPADDSAWFCCRPFQAALDRVSSLVMFSHPPPHLISSFSFMSLPFAIYSCPVLSILTKCDRNTISLPSTLGLPACACLHFGHLQKKLIQRIQIFTYTLYILAWRSTHIWCNLFFYCWFYCCHCICLHNILEFIPLQAKLSHNKWSYFTGPWIFPMLNLLDAVAI